MRLVDYTSDVERLREAIMQLGVRAETPEGGRVVEAVFDSAKELRDVERPVIIVLTDTHTAYSSLPAHHVLDELQRSGALLQVIAVARVAPLNPSSVPLAKDKPADLLEHQLDINRVLGDGPKQSGGRRLEIGGLGGTIPELQGVAAELRQQYLITYLVPAGEKLNQKLSVSSKRRGVTVRAPSRGGREPDKLLKRFCCIERRFSCGCNQSQRHRSTKIQLIVVPTFPKHRSADLQVSEQGTDARQSSCNGRGDRIAGYLVGRSAAAAGCARRAACAGRPRAGAAAL